jgi:hypothetical protein
MQVQYYPRAGAPSAPFRFIDTLHNNLYTGSTAVPEKNQFIRPLTASRSMDRKLQLILDESFLYDFQINDRLVKTMTLSVKMDETACYYLSEKDSSARLYFSIQDNIFSFYQFTGTIRSPLKYLLIALPRIPVTEETITWSDKLSSLYFAKAPFFYSLLRSFNHTLFTSVCTHTLTVDGVVHGNIDVNLLFRKQQVTTLLTFNSYRLFDKVEVIQQDKKYTLTRKCIDL